LAVLSRRLVPHRPFLKVRGSNLGPETGNMNCLRCCPKFHNKPSAHPRFAILLQRHREQFAYWNCRIKVMMQYTANTSVQ